MIIGLHFAIYVIIIKYMPFIFTKDTTELYSYAACCSNVNEY